MHEHKCQKCTAFLLRCWEKLTCSTTVCIYRHLHIIFKAYTYTLLLNTTPGYGFFMQSNPWYDCNRISFARCFPWVFSRAHVFMWKLISENFFPSRIEIFQLHSICVLHSYMYKTGLVELNSNLRLWYAITNLHNIIVIKCILSFPYSIR